MLWQKRWVWLCLIEHKWPVSVTILDVRIFPYLSAILQKRLLQFLGSAVCSFISLCSNYCLCGQGRVEGQRCKSVHWGWSLCMAFTSPNWCTEAGAGGNLQECQLSILEALPPAHLIKGQIDGASGSSMSIRTWPSGNYTDYKKLGWLNNPLKGQGKMEKI